MSNIGIEHRAARVSFVNGLSVVLSIAFQLISVPICLKYWGQNVYGSWLSLFAAFLLLKSFDSGYVAYVGNKLNQLYHYDTAAFKSHLSSAVVGVAIIGSLQLVLVLSVLSFDGFAKMLGVPSDKIYGSKDKIGLLVLMTSWILTGSYLGIVHRLLVPAGLMYQASWWAMAFQVSQFAAIMAAALFQLSILQTSALFSISQLVIYGASAIYARQKLPMYYPWWQGVRIRIGLEDLGRSTPLTASNLIQQGATNGVVLVISALAGPAAVPAFATVRTLSNLWSTVTNVLTMPLLPDVVRFHAVDQGRKLWAVNQAYLVLVGSVVNCGVLLSYPLLEPLFAFWTGHEVELDKALLCLLLSSVVVCSTGGLMAMYLNGINSLRMVLIMSLIRGVVVLGGGALLFNYFGLTAFGISILISETTVLAIMSRYFYCSPIFKKVEIKLLQTFYPALLSTGSVCLFLIVNGLNVVTGLWAWHLAFASVLAGAVWGWKKMDIGLKNRLISVNPFSG
jgi:O-antigen/teichoic acid export membrane protein